MPSDQQAKEVERLKRKTYDTEPSVSMSLRAEGGRFQLNEDVHDGATIRVDDLDDNYLALVGWKEVDGQESAAYFEVGFDEARDLAEALQAAADLHDEVTNST